MPDPIYKYKDGRVFSRSKLIASGYTEERIDKGMELGTLSLIGDTELPDQSYKGNDGKEYTTKQLLEAGYSQERIDAGVSNGVLIPQQSIRANFVQPEKKKVGSISYEHTPLFSEAQSLSEKSLTDIQDVIKAKELYEKKIPKIEGGRRLVYEPDEEAQKESQGIITKLQEKGYSPDEIDSLYKDFKDFPAKEAKGVNYNQLLQERKENPLSFKRTMSAYKWQTPLFKAIREKEGQDADITINRILSEQGAANYEKKRRDTANLIKSVREYVDDTEQQDKIIKEIENDRAISYGILDEDKWQSIQNDDRYIGKGGNLNQAQMVGMQFLEDTDPAKAALYNRFLSVKPERKFGEENYIIGWEQKAKYLEDLGMSLQAKALEEGMTSLIAKKNKGEVTEQDISQYQKLYDQYSTLLQDAEEQKNRFPTTAAMEADRLMQEANGQRNNAGKRFLLKTGENVDDLVNWVGDVIQSPFRGKEEKIIDDLEDFGSKEFTETFQTYRTKANQLVGEDGKINFTANAIFNTIADVGAEVVSNIGTTVLTGGIGNVSKARRLSSLFGGVFGTTYNDYYTQAIREDIPNPSTFATVHTAVEAASELINPDLSAVKKIIKPNTAFGQIIKNVSKTEWDDIVKASTGKFSNILDAVKSGTVAAAKNAFQETFEEIAGQIGGNVSDIALFNQDIDLVDGLKSTVVNTLVGTLPLGFLGIPGQIAQLNRSQKYALYEVAQNKEKYLPQLDIDVKNGLLTPEKAEQIRTVIENASQSLNEISANNTINIEQADNDKTDILAEQLGVEDIKGHRAFGEDVEKEQQVGGEDEILISEMIDKTGTYKGEKGYFYQDGQTVVFKIDGKNKEYELGNVEEVKSIPISDFGITHEQSVVDINNEGGINVRGTDYVNNYSNPLAAINKDANGNVVSVNLETTDGKKRTFRGNIAEDIAYQINLKEINKNNETRAEFEQHLNEDAAASKEMDNGAVLETTNTESVKDNEPVSREKVKPKQKSSKSQPIKEGGIQSEGQERRQEASQVLTTPQTESTGGEAIPPAEPPLPVTQPTPEDEQLSGVKKGLVSEEVLKGVDLERIGDKEMMEKGRQIIDSGEVKPRELVQKIVTEKVGNLTPAEVVALTTYKADIDNQLGDKYKELNDKNAKGEETGTLGVEIANLERDIHDFEVASVITAQQQSMAFRLRKWMLDRDYNLVTQTERYKANNNGVIPEEVENKFKELDKKLKEVKRKITELEAKKELDEAQLVIDNIKKDVEREIQRGGINQKEVEKKVKEGISKEIDAIYEKLPKEKKSLANKAIKALEDIQTKIRGKSYSDVTGMIAIVDAGITTIKNAIKAGVAIADAIELGIQKIKELMVKSGIKDFKEDEFRADMTEGFKGVGKKEITVDEDGKLKIPDSILRDYVKSGVTDINDLTDKVFQDAVRVKPDATKREVRDAITDYGRKVNPTQDKIKLQLNTAKRIGRLLSELEDLRNKKEGEKNPSTKAKLTEKEKELKRQIRALEKDLGIDRNRSLTDEEKLQYAKDRIKRRIEELERRIRNKDFSKKEKLPTPKDAELVQLEMQKQKIQEEFDNEQYKIKLKQRNWWQKLEDIALEITGGVIRGLVASFDLSAFLVQGMFRAFVDFGKSGLQLIKGKRPTPNRTVQAFVEMVKHLVSQKYSDNYLSKIKASEAYPLLQASKLAIDDKSGHVSAKEGFFISNWVNLIWNHAIAPALAMPISIATKGNVRKGYDIAKEINPYLASQRAFDGYINAIRVNTFSDMAKSLQNDGYNFDADPDVFKKAADFVNTTTGRGSLGSADASSRWLNIFLFAPRKVVSEVKMFTPYAFLYYSKMPPPVRKRALQNLGTFAATFLGVNALMWAASRGEYDDDDEWWDFWDLRSSNFLSHKVGGKRVSVGGGMKSMIVFQSRFWSKKYVDQYGKETTLGDRFGKQINTRFDLLTNFIAGKTSPAINVAIQKFQERRGLEVENKDILKDLTVPIFMQDLKNMYKEDPTSVNAILTLFSIFGANVRTVDEQKRNPFTEEDKKDPTFKYFLDKGMELPNVVPASIDVPDSETKTIKNLTEFPEEKIREYQDEHKKNLKSELSEIKNRGFIYKDDYGSISQNKKEGYEKIPLDELSKEDLAKILKSAQIQATEKTKEKLFPKKELTEMELRRKTRKERINERKRKRLTE